MLDPSACRTVDGMTIEDARVTMLDMKVIASQESDGPLRVKVTVTREYVVENVEPETAIAEVLG